MEQLIKDSDYQLLKDLMDCQTESGKIIPDKFIPYSKHDYFSTYDEDTLSGLRERWDEEEADHLLVFPDDLRWLQKEGYVQLFFDFIFTSLPDSPGAFVNRSRITRKGLDYVLKRDAQERKNDEIRRHAELENQKSEQEKKRLEEVEAKRFQTSHKDNISMTRATILAGIGGALLGSIATFLLGKFF